jgi:hypothetical protein
MSISNLYIDSLFAQTDTISVTNLVTKSIAAINVNEDGVIISSFFVKDVVRPINGYREGTLEVCAFFGEEASSINSEAVKIIVAKVAKLKPGYSLIGGDLASGSMIFSDVEYLSGKEAASITRLNKRPGVGVAQPLVAQFVSFSANNLTKQDVDGVFGLLTSADSSVAVGLGKLNAFQATLDLDNNCLMAKGLIAMAVSPKQRAIVALAEEGVDVIINLDEVKAFFGVEKPEVNSVRVLVDTDLRILNKCSSDNSRAQITRTTMELLSDNSEVVSALVTAREAAVAAVIKQFNEGDFVALFDAGVISPVGNVAFCIKNGIVLNESQIESIKRSVEEEIVRMYSRYYVPANTRYVSACETLEMNEMMVPANLVVDYPIGSHVLVLSHPMIFGYTHSVVKVVGTVDSDLFVFNNEMLSLINRDCDGDKMALPVPAYLPLENTYVPQHSGLSAR